MPSKDYRIWLSDKAFIVVEFVMVRGRIVSFVVRRMLLENGHESNVARCDTAHGAPHLDVLGKRRGLLSKTWYVDVPANIVLRRAVDDFRNHYENYIRNYQKH